ncbi:MAG: hypothetical protein HON14_03840 [Rhodospirillaceae bacterium]|jgi:hypothetical protein|nr:hypothetical protein [Rhodospirillaceae bacterium]MBT4938240.1 hypothetical protein [Rhodospirillaceae bacterium]MBT7268381.1 hypothetical protein [Rhodospirillaceae bacterium]
MLTQVRTWIGALTDIGLSLIGLGIVLGILVGSKLPFVGDVVGNLTALINNLGAAGLVGLIALGVIIWLLRGRSA